MGAGPKFPNSTSDWNPSNSEYVETCGATVETGCLFDILQDPGEHVNLAAKKPEVFQQMMKRVAELQQTVFSPHRGEVDPAACDMALGKYKGFWGPFVGTERSATVAFV